MCSCLHACACLPTFGQRGGAFLTPCQRRYLRKGGFRGGLPPNEQIWSCQGKNSCIHWMTLIFSHFTQVQWTKQAGESWGRHFLRFRRRWQTCSNYLKSKQTPRKQAFLGSFVTAFIWAALCFFFMWCELCVCARTCVCVCTYSTAMSTFWKPAFHLNIKIPNNMNQYILVRTRTPYLITRSQQYYTPIRYDVRFYFCVCVTFFMHVTLIKSLIKVFLSNSRHRFPFVSIFAHKSERSQRKVDVKWCF